MTRSEAIDSARRVAIISSGAGYPFLLVFACVWTGASVLSYVVPREVAPWVYLFLGLPAMPIAIYVERRVASKHPTDGKSEFLPLTLQILFVQIVAYPAVMIVWSVASDYVPVAFAAVVGAHFLPFQWVYRTPLYGILGVVVAVGPYLIAAVAGEDSLHYTGFFVGAALAAGAWFARSHAIATSLGSQDAARTAGN